MDHRTELLAAEEIVYGPQLCYGSSPFLMKPPHPAPYTLNMSPGNQPLRHLFMGYYRQAIAEIERGAVIIAESNEERESPNGHGPGVCQGIPIVGPSVDRRTFGHLREVYNDEELYALACFVCAQRRTHTKHINSAIQRRHLELFKDQTQRPENAVLRIHMTQQYLKNFCRKTFLHRFARKDTPLWKAGYLGPMEAGTEVGDTIGLPRSHQRQEGETAELPDDDAEAEEPSDADVQVCL